MLRGLLFVTIAAAAVSALPAAAGGADGQLVGTVGPGFTISLADASGARVTHVDPGTYTLLVHDQADVHDFHLACGPDANVATDVEFVGDETFTVTLKDGATCNYYCDPHITAMRGSFTVGTVAATPTATTPKTTAKTLAATLRLGPGKTLRVPRSLRAGRYALRLDDRSRTDSLRLKGPGVDRATGVRFVGVKRVGVTLKRGVYTVATKSATRRIVVR